MGVATALRGGNTDIEELGGVPPSKAPFEGTAVDGSMVVAPIASENGEDASVEVATIRLIIGENAANREPMMLLVGMHIPMVSHNN